MTKRLAALLLAVAMLFCLAACGKKAAPAPEATPVPTEAPATATPESTEELEIVYVGTPAPAGEQLTFEGTLNIYNGSTLTVSNANETGLFYIVEGTVLPAKLNPGSAVKVVFTETESGRNNAVEITVTSATAAAATVEEAATNGGTVVGYLSEAEQDHVCMNIDGVVYRFAVDLKTFTKLNANVVDAGDYVSITYTGILTDAPQATVIDKLGGPSAQQSNGNIIYVVTTPAPAPTYDPNYIKPVENPMKNGSGTVVSVGGSTIVVRMGNNDCWFTVQPGAGGIPAVGSKISFEYNSGLGEITRIY